MKLRFISFLFFSAFIANAIISPAEGDTIELNSGQVIECIILSESFEEVKIQYELGKLTLHRAQIASVTRADELANKMLLQQWHTDKKDYMNALQKDRYLTQQAPAPDKSKMIRYGDKWITQEEYAKLKVETKERTAEMLEKKIAEHEALQKKKEEEDLRRKTIELIRQGEKRRSRYGNALLKTKGWTHKISNNFVLFFSETDDPRLAKHIQSLSEYYFDKIKGDLDLKKDFSFDEAIEVFLISDKSIWPSLLQNARLLETTAGFANHHYKEIYLDASISSRQLEQFFAHELTHLIFREYIIDEFSKKHYIPLWLNEGLANYEGGLIDFALTQNTLTDGINKNYAIKLDELLIIYSYPKDITTLKFFYAESTKLVEYIITNYGREALNEFIHRTIRMYHQNIKRPESASTKNVRKILRLIILNSFLRRDFTGYSSFEEAWLKYMIE